jgi:hypothetical protein
LLEECITSTFKRVVIKYIAAKIDEKPDSQTNGELSAVAFNKFYVRYTLHASRKFGEGAC